VAEQATSELEGKQAANSPGKKIGCIRIAQDCQRPSTFCSRAFDSSKSLAQPFQRQRMQFLDCKMFTSRTSKSSTKMTESPICTALGKKSGNQHALGKVQS